MVRRGLIGQKNHFFADNLNSLPDVIHHRVTQMQLLQTQEKTGKSCLQKMAVPHYCGLNYSSSFSVR